MKSAKNAEATRFAGVFRQKTTFCDFVYFADFMLQKPNILYWKIEKSQNIENALPFDMACSIMVGVDELKISIGENVS